MGLHIVHTTPRDVEVHLNHWLDLTHATPAARETIHEALTRTAGAQNHRHAPLQARPTKLLFLHDWLIVIG